METPSVRPSACAGRFFPKNNRELASMEAQFLDVPAPFEEVPRAVIGPHAGCPFSASTAGDRDSVVGYGAWVVC